MTRRISLRAAAVLCALVALSQLATAKFVPDPIVNYKIDARLDANAKTIHGREVIQWRNHTTTPVPDLHFHLYLNAFKNNKSTFMREGGAESRRVPFIDKQDSWGWQQVHSIKVNGQDLTGKMEYIQPDDGNKDDQTVVRVPLTTPVPANGRIVIEIDWTSKMPRVFARTGFYNNFFFVAQWFPKIGVWEGVGDRHRTTAGWNAHQFHTSTEFFADYGVYDVDLTVPSTFEIAATGTQRAHKDNGDGTTTYNYYQEDVHDFAWTTQPRDQVIKQERWFRASDQVSQKELEEWAAKHRLPVDQIRLTDVKVTAFIQREHEDQVDRHFRAVFAGIKWYGLMFGNYPYEVATVVDPPPFGGAGAGGMEYPTFFTAGTQYMQSARGGDPEGVTIHEFGHQFWYGMVGNNEFEEPWLDEGFNSYSDTKTMWYEYGYTYPYRRVMGFPVPGLTWASIPVPKYPWIGIDAIAMGPLWEWVPQDPFRARARRYLEHAQTDPMQKFAWLMLDRASYGDQAYSKPEQTLHTLEAILGDKWWPAIRTYHQRFRFKHPDAYDFVSTMQESTGLELKWFFDQTMHGTGLLNYSVSFEAEEAEGRRGYFDKTGNPEYADGKEKGLPAENTVLVRRIGEMQFPVKLRVKFADGSERYEMWDGIDRWKRFQYTGSKVVEAQIDPDNAWKLEVPRVDNSQMAKRTPLAADKWYLRWVVWVQNLMNAAGYFA